MPPILPPETGLAAEVLGWRLLGSYVWHAGAVAACNVALAFFLPLGFRTFFSIGGVFLYLVLYGLQCGVLLAHRMVLSAAEFEHVTFPQLGIHGRSWISLFLTRVIVRGRNLGSLTGVAALFGSTMLTGSAYIHLYSRMRLGTGLPLVKSVWLGCVLGLVYSLRHLLG